MTQLYEAVVQLADQLSPHEQTALRDHLHEKLQSQDDFHAWLVTFEQLKIATPVIGTLSDHRADWYGDDGR